MGMDMNEDVNMHGVVIGFNGDECNCNKMRMECPFLQ